MEDGANDIYKSLRRLQILVFWHLNLSKNDWFHTPNVLGMDF